jgi:DNA-binding HxlR family transcriptional regulator
MTSAHTDPLMPGGSSPGAGPATGAEPSTVGDRDYTPLSLGGVNALGTALGLLGDEWSLWIVREAIMEKAERYRDWMNAGAISNSVLTTRLSLLTDAGMFRRERSPQAPGRSRYVVTRRGRDVWPILIAMRDWEVQWIHPRNSNIPSAWHRTCGRAFAPILVCGECRVAVHARDVSAHTGPSGDWRRNVPAVATRRRANTAERLPSQIPQTMVLIGNRWSSATLAAAFLGAKRFGEFADRLGAPPTIIADRLRTFCEIGVLEEVPGVDRPSWVTYRLTDKGRSFYPVLAFLVEWSQKWFKAPEGDALIPRHRGCGALFHPRMECDQCGELLYGRDIAIQ